MYVRRRISHKKSAREGNRLLVLYNAHAIKFVPMNFVPSLLEFALSISTPLTRQLSATSALKAPFYFQLEFEIFC